MHMDDDAGSTASRARLGIILGVVAATAYSLANPALRQLSDSGPAGGPGWDVWVTALKAVATGVSAWTIVLYRQFHGRLVGVLIRYFVRTTLEVESVLIVFSTLGISSLSAIAIGLSG